MIKFSKTLRCFRCDLETVREKPIQFLIRTIRRPPLSKQRASSSEPFHLPIPLNGKYPPEYCRIWPLSANASRLPAFPELISNRIATLPRPRVPPAGCRIESSSGYVTNRRRSLRSTETASRFCTRRNADNRIPARPRPRPENFPIIGRFADYTHTGPSPRFPNYFRRGLCRGLWQSITASGTRVDLSSKNKKGKANTMKTNLRAFTVELIRNRSTVKLIRRTFSRAARIRASNESITGPRSKFSVSDGRPVRTKGGDSLTFEIVTRCDSYFRPLERA